MLLIITEQKYTGDTGSYVTKITQRQIMTRVISNYDHN